MSKNQKRTERYDSFICNLCMLVIRSFCRFIAKYIGLRARPISVYKGSQTQKSIYHQQMPQKLKRISEHL
jgi:hypothetical protein